MSQPSFRARTAATLIGMVVLVAACHGKENDDHQGSAAAAPAATAAAPENTLSSTPLTPAPGRKVIVVKANTDANGSSFQPSEIEAERGDVIRFTLQAGVHNVDFLPDSNPKVAGLPAPSDMLQLPGQTLDFAVTLPKGTYYFQCDPHSALGMKGHLKVED